ncbi:uncharacterized protein LOC112456324 [Temnothorax curvispinosus]|uniref:Uncharacterized protein LOC112456324 n=1 Tax=Temnothorax curvispinosus TaxID=300111 RepID=A0A6J1PZ76_9HYME|nr:uncharacterized protein LOC112456324 [Temnothorax curvispinosus]
MVVLSGSSSRSAWFFLIALVTIIYRSAGEPSQLIVCSQPDSFTVQITENEHVVYGTELLIRHNPHVGIFSYPEIKPVNVVFNETVIEFKGYVSPKYPVTQQYISSEKLSWNASGIILGIGTLQKLSKKDYAVQDCRLFLPTNIKGSTNLPKAVEKTIIYYVQSCAQELPCQKIRALKAEQLQNISRYEAYGYNILHIIRPNNLTVAVVLLILFLYYILFKKEYLVVFLFMLSVVIRRRPYILKKDENSKNTWWTPSILLNVPMDILLKKVINYIKQNKKSIIKIPGVIKTYNIVLGMIKCHFETDNGIFEDLSTLKRTKDAVMSNIGQTHIIQTSFGLSMAKFKYDYYKLEIGPTTISGNILGTVDGLAMTARLVINYDKTCGVNLEYVKVEFGKINLEMTGLGPLNSLASTIFTWLTEKWQDKIVKNIEINVKNIAEEQLTEFIYKTCNNEDIKYFFEL